MDDGTDGGYEKLTEESNPSLNVDSWSKPEFEVPATNCSEFTQLFTTPLCSD